MFLVFIVIIVDIFDIGTVAKVIKACLAASNLKALLSLSTSCYNLYHHILH